jgi:hypothetical protein
MSSRGDAPHIRRVSWKNREQTRKDKTLHLGSSKTDSPRAGSSTVSHRVQHAIHAANIQLTGVEHPLIAVGRCCGCGGSCLLKKALRGDWWSSSLVNGETVLGRDQEIAWCVHLAKAGAAEFGAELGDGCDVFVHHVDIRNVRESRSVETAHAATGNIQTTLPELLNVRDGVDFAVIPEHDAFVGLPIEGFVASYTNTALRDGSWRLGRAAEEVLRLGLACVGRHGS